MVFQKELKTWYLLAFVLLCLPLGAVGQQTAQPPHTVRAPTPIEPGDIDIHATVTVTLEVR